MEKKPQKKKETRRAEDPSRGDAESSRALHYEYGIILLTVD